MTGSGEGVRGGVGREWECGGVTGSVRGVGRECEGSVGECEGEWAGSVRGGVGRECGGVRGE